ncbi:MAG: hypothetical protein NTZ90_16470 [Proteobacteria bacterium]|nr:hypothetical protein [Pseudomonadota bacterium]
MKRVTLFASIAALILGIGHTALAADTLATCKSDDGLQVTLTTDADDSTGTLVFGHSDLDLTTVEGLEIRHFGPIILAIKPNTRYYFLVRPRNEAKVGLLRVTNQEIYNDLTCE